MQRIKIPIKLPSLNDVTRANRSHKMQGAKMKKTVERNIMFYLQRHQPIKKPCHITFIWQEANKRRDLDNIASAKKFVLDALVKAGKLKDDNRRIVTGFTDEFTYGDTWGVTLEIREVET